MPDLYSQKDSQSYVYEDYESKRAKNLTFFVPQSLFNGTKTSSDFNLRSLMYISTTSRSIRSIGTRSPAAEENQNKGLSGLRFDGDDEGEEKREERGKGLTRGGDGRDGGDDVEEEDTMGVGDEVRRRPADRAAALATAAHSDDHRRGGVAGHPLPREEKRRTKTGVGRRVEGIGEEAGCGFLWIPC